MILIRPQAVTDSVLTLTNIIESPPGAWSSGTTYSVDSPATLVSGTTVTSYRSLQAGNLNHDPSTSPTWWKQDGTTYLAYSGSADYLAGQRVIDATAHRVHESLVGTTAAVTLSIAAPCVVGWIGHGLAANTPVVFTTTGALPTGLSAGPIYYVLSPTANAFNLSATPGGAAINTSGTQSGTHTAIANPNQGNPPATSPTFWLDVGPTNRWGMFDAVVGTVTSHPYVIDITMALSGRVDSLALMNMTNAVTARIVVSTVADGTVYDQTIGLTSTDGIGDMYSWFFEDIERKPDLLVTDLPVYLNPSVRVVITGPGTVPVSCGNLAVGLKKDLGETLHDGAEVGIIDYSRKEVDQFGNISLVERPFSRRGAFKMRLDKSKVDGVHRVLSQFRAVPAVYAADEGYGSTLIYGFFRQFGIEIDTPLASLCSLEIEGLT